MNNTELMKTALSVASKVSQEKAQKQKEIEYSYNEMMINIVNLYIRDKVSKGMKFRTARRKADKRFNIKFKK